ncbi:probable serine/threonine-protein kinase PknB [Homarus americanus]|uniref:probable serine/threonine-protein kinase PknB n=1 Tax=Homarus americanus TaxID=6706 RepID=UPI001C45C876|nr:probable serine/threonine-protein kinase PknB [Homarus americanus]
MLKTLEVVPHVVALCKAPYTIITRFTSDKTIREWLLSTDGHIHDVSFMRAILQIVNAVDAIHKHGIIHNLLIDENIMINHVGNKTFVTIDNFCLATKLDEQEPHPCGALNKIQDKLWWVAPEVFYGVNASTASDVFAMCDVINTICKRIWKKTLPLQPLLERGRSKNPANRPTLAQFREKVIELLERSLYPD